MIKTVDLVWTKVIGEMQESQIFSFGYFTVLLTTGNIYESALMDGIHGIHDSLIGEYKTLEEAKQACQDYLQKIVEEIVK